MRSTTASKAASRSGSIGAASSSERTSTALPVSSSSRWAISSTAYLAARTSPCSVIFSRPSTVPRGRARMATLVGPPPRPTAPPRPWKKTQLTPRARNTRAMCTWARYVAHEEAT